MVLLPCQATYQASMFGFVSRLLSQSTYTVPVTAWILCSTTVRRCRWFGECLRYCQTLSTSSMTPKRRGVLGVNLLTFCETRFIQRHDAILWFTDNFDGVLGALQDIAESAAMDAKTETKALSFVNAVSNASFLVSLAAAKKVMSLTLMLSTGRRPQSRN